MGIWNEPYRQSDTTERYTTGNPTAESEILNTGIQQRPGHPERVRVVVRWVSVSLGTARRERSTWQKSRERRQCTDDLEAGTFRESRTHSVLREDEEAAAIFSIF